MSIFDIDFETMPREGLEAIQLRRLQNTLQRVYATVPFYRRQFETAGITPKTSGPWMISRIFPLPPNRI